MLNAHLFSAGARTPAPASRALGGRLRSRRLVASSLLVAAMLVLAACSSSPRQADGDAKELASKSEPLAEYMSRAQAAEALDGGRERARLIYRDAAKAYPTDTRPWSRLAQSYFDAADYGNAVLAAQEVVQRDPSDTAAQGLLAVSGLRISTAALSALRGQNGLSTSTRSEAEDMARNLRAILGESVLVPKPPEAATPVVRPAVRPAPRATVPVRRVPAPQPTAPAAPAAPSNPFGALR